MLVEIGTEDRRYCVEVGSLEEAYALEEKNKRFGAAVEFEQIKGLCDSIRKELAELESLAGEMLQTEQNANDGIKQECLLAAMSTLRHRLVEVDIALR